MMLTPEAAWRAIAEHLAPLPAVDAPRQDAAGRVLARPLAATVDMPPADVSAMDGYAVCGDVTPGAALTVVDTVAAGRPSAVEVRPGEAAKIMTGAVVPRGADRVIPVEQTDGGGERVVCHAAPAPGEHVRRRAEVVRAGAPLCDAGTALSAGAVALAASHGYAALPVYRAPRVAVMATGNEVVPPETEPGPGQLRDSNSPFLLAACRALGLAPRALGIAPDDPEELRRRIRQGLDDDVLLLCGGVSMGEYDYVEDALAELGCTTLFERVAIQPGKPLVAARHARGWVFGLPGNPASVMVTFRLFVHPLLRRLQGHADGFWHGALRAVLTAPLPGSRGRDRFLAAAVDLDDGVLRATPYLPRGSHDLAAYARGTALLRLHADADPLPAGARCEVLPLAPAWAS